MSEERENITITLFDKLCLKYGGEVLEVDNLRKSFIPQKFNYSDDNTLGDI